MIKFIEKYLLLFCGGLMTLTSSIGHLLLMTFAFYVAMVLLGFSPDGLDLMDIQIFTFSDFEKDPNYLMAFGLTYTVLSNYMIKMIDDHYEKTY